jgi:hypothetical protein
LLFDGKSIREGKDRIKGKNWANGIGTEGGLLEKKDFSGLDFTDGKGGPKGNISGLWMPGVYCATGRFGNWE